MSCRPPSRRGSNEKKPDGLRGVGTRMRLSNEDRKCSCPGGKAVHFSGFLTVLDGPFADGDRLRFELGLSALIDFCTDVVDAGDCDQWWSESQ